MMIIPNKLYNPKLIFVVFYLILLIVGVSVYKDYGISWDEPISRDNNGMLNYNFIHTGDYQSLIAGNEKYHGPAFEIFLIYIERICGLKNMQDIYHMRHLVTFLLFAISVLFFYFICIRYFKSQWLALFGSVFLVLSPRIFADAFYNSKDLAFMSFFIINIYTTLLFHEKKNISSALLHAVITAIVIDIRILGIIIPFISLLFLVIDFIRIPKMRIRIFFITVTFCCFLIATVILCWPVLWKNPIGNFLLALKEMSKYPWDGYVLYNGKSILAPELPWHYLPFWILISTPVIYLGLFITGISAIIRKIIFKWSISTFELLNIYIFFVPLLAVIFLHSVVYDGWRHMFFIYPSILFISMEGLKTIFYFCEKNKIIYKVAVAGVIVYSLSIGTRMFLLHPYENVYFNLFAGNSLKEAQSKFESDYWGLSYKEGLEYILKNDTSKYITICTENLPGIYNSRILNENERSRISFTFNRELADYFITNYRDHHTEYNLKSSFDVIRDKGILLSVMDLRNIKLDLTNNKYKVAHFINTYEEVSNNWTFGKIINVKDAYSGKKVELVDSSTKFSMNFTCQALNEITVLNRAKNYMDVSFQIRTHSSYDCKIVFQVDSGNGITYGYLLRDIQSSLSDKWLKEDFKFVLPDIISAEDIIKVYIWNTGRSNFYIDDFEINIYSVPSEKVHSIYSLIPI